MKGYHLFAMSVAVGLWLCACGDDTGSGGEAAGGALEMQALTLSVSPEVGGVPVSEGDELLFVDVALENTTGATLSLATVLFSVQTPNGVQYFGDPLTDAHPNGCPVNGSLAAGGSLECTLVFTVPKDREVDTLLYTTPDATTTYETALPECSNCEGLCGAPGHYLLALSLSLDPQKAFALDATVTANDADPLTLDLELQPLSKEDQMSPVGDALTFMALPVDLSGSFEWHFGAIALVEASNPISAFGIDLDMTIAGELCGTESGFLCGDVSGTITEPINGYDIVGSTFTMQRYDSARPSPLLNCQKDPAVYPSRP